MAAIPRPASTVVLMNDLSEVYLTKRPQTMKFFGGYYVFPGGAVEEDDYGLGNQFQAIKNEFDPAYLVAAARELFEEVGVLLCEECKVPSEMDYRRKLINGELSFFQILKQERITLNLENLQYFGNITTPKERPIRFDTRFFLTQLPIDQIPCPDENEIDQASWFTPRRALEAYQNEEILLAPPTIHALKTIQDYLNGEPLMMPEFKR